MTWNETNLALKILKAKFNKLPKKTKENSIEYETLAKPLRLEAIELHYIRIGLNQKHNYE